MTDSTSIAILTAALRRHAAAILLVSAAAALGVSGWGYWSLWQSKQTAFATNDELPSLITLPKPKPLAEFILVDDAKNVFDLKSLDARWSFIFFGFMYCPDICPTTLYDLSHVKREIVARGIPEEELQFVFVSVDPARDKAEQIKKYVRYFDPSFLGTTGSIGQLTNLTRQLGAPFRLEQETADNVYDVTHSSAVYLVDPLGQFAGVINPPLVAPMVADEFARLFFDT